MALDRAISLIGDLRSLMGDELDRTTGNTITDFLVQNGTGWTAQAMANALRLSANEILETAFMTLRSAEKAARMFPEYMKVTEMSNAYKGGEGTYSRYALPVDYGWAIGGRYKQYGKSQEWVVSFEESLRHVDGAIAADNPEDAYRAIAWVEGEDLCVTLGGPSMGGSATVGAQPDTFNFRYIALQPYVDVAGSQDIIMRARWDRQLLAGARKALAEFKQ